MNHPTLEDADVSELEREALEARTDVDQAIDEGEGKIPRLCETGDTDVRDNCARLRLPQAPALLVATREITQKSVRVRYRNLHNPSPLEWQRPTHPLDTTRPSSAGIVW